MSECRVFGFKNVNLAKFASIAIHKFNSDDAFNGDQEGFNYTVGHMINDSIAISN